MQGIRFDADHGVLICATHRAGVHPSENAVRRHLRGSGHHCKGGILKEAVSALCQHPLKSTEALLQCHPPLDTQPITAIQDLTIHDGWSCRACLGAFLTTSLELRDRHVSSCHQQQPRHHSASHPLWDQCRLQTLFGMTGERRYFRVKTPLGDSDGDILASRATEADESALMFIRSVEEQRRRNEEIARQASNVNPDPLIAGATSELWMRKLGLDRYVAGLHKDEMATSYTVLGEEADQTLQSLIDVSDAVLRGTWRECQHGPEQRLTDPQAARLSRFWQAGDPEGAGRPFRRAIEAETLDSYLGHWKQLLTFCWNGLRGELFANSLADLAEKTSQSGMASSRDAAQNGRHGPVQSSQRDDLGSPMDDDDDDDDNDNDNDREDTGSSDGGSDPQSRYLHFTRRQRRCMQEFLVRARGCLATDMDEKVRQLRESAIAFARSIIEQSLARSPFESPLLAYVAMLAVNGKYNSWEEPGSFNSNLSRLIYCGQLWVFRLSCDVVDEAVAERRGSLSDSDETGDGLDKELDRQLQRYFSNTVSRPFGYLLLWRRRLFKIAPLTMVNRPAWWSLDGTVVTYQGVSVSMDEVRLLCRHTIDRASKALHEGLLLGARHLPKGLAKRLEENDSQRSIGWWFGMHSKNAALLRNHNNTIIEHVASTPALRDTYLECDQQTVEGVPQLVWKQGGIRLYRQLVQDFLNDVAVATHISAGPPVRGSEFLKPIWRNTEQLRHIQLRHGHVLIHLVDHKMGATTGKNVNNLRFLCSELSQLLVQYLVYVVPVLESMAWQEDVRSSISPYLWCDSDGKQWSEAKFGERIRAACRRAQVTEFGTSIWRQMSAAIINKHFDQVDKACLAAAQDQGDIAGAADVEEDGDDALPSALISMSNHSLRTHRMAYANVSPFANVWDGKLAKSFQASRAWAAFFGLGDDIDQGGDGVERTDRLSHKRVASSAAQEQAEARKTIDIGRRHIKPNWTGSSLLQQARGLLKNAELRWRSLEQEQAMLLVANKAPEVLLVLATGAGKSLMFMLGCSLPGARTTVVIVPLVMLRLDLIRRCRELELSPVVWSSREDLNAAFDSTPTLLFVSVEVAASHPFRQFVQRLYDTGNLDRIMLDECHLIHTSGHYRRHMRKLNELRQFKVPFVYMTATLPPRLERSLSVDHLFGAASIVRGNTKRSNIHYSVEHIIIPKGGEFLAIVCEEIQQRWAKAPRSDWEAPRGMIFVRSQGEAEDVAERIGSAYYHGEVGTTQEKEGILKDWISGAGGSELLACTTAAGAGVDYPHVRWVVHIEEPYGLLDFAQESGRAGRDGEEAGSTVFLKRDPKEGMAMPTAFDHPDPDDDRAIKEYLLGRQCRRLGLARELDAPQQWQECGDSDVVCDVCKGKSAENVGDGEGGKTKETGEKEAELAAGEGSEGVEGGLMRYQRKQLQEQFEMDEYIRGLEQIRGQCMSCRVLKPTAGWNHSMQECRQQEKWEYFRCRGQAVQSSGKGGWMKRYSACFRCGQPQNICENQGKVSGKGTQGGCKYRDLVLPLIWALWKEAGREREWVQEVMGWKVGNGCEALLAAGRAGRFGGVDCIVGVVVMHKMLKRWGGG